MSHLAHSQSHGGAGGSFRGGFFWETMFVSRLSTSSPLARTTLHVSID
jgi:hypothetical protein